MKDLILTVQSNGNGGYRLGISKEDSLEYFKCRGVRVHLYLGTNKRLMCKTACGNCCDERGNWLKNNPKTGKPYSKKGYDLNHKELSEWIKTEGFNNYKTGYPKKLIFKIEILQGEIHLTYFDKKTSP